MRACLALFSRTCHSPENPGENKLPAWADRYLTLHHLELEDSCSVLIRSGLNLAPWSTFAHEGP